MYDENTRELRITEQQLEEFKYDENTRELRITEQQLEEFKQHIHGLFTVDGLARYQDFLRGLGHPLNVPVDVFVNK